MSKQAQDAPFPCKLCERRFASLHALFVHLKTAHNANSDTSPKYLNKKVVVGDTKFDSQKEALRWGELRLLERAGEITDLEVQPKFPLLVAGTKVGTYTADFRYKEKGKVVVEDVKSPATRKNPVYRLKARLMLALYRIRIQEV